TCSTYTTLVRSACMRFKYDWQHLGESHVGVIMIKSKPALLNMFRQTRQAFVNRIPLTKSFQPLRLSVLYAFIEVEQSLITHVLNEIQVYAGQVIMQDEVRSLCDKILIITGNQQPDTERSFKKDTNTVKWPTRCFDDRFMRGSFGFAFNEGKDSSIPQRSRCLKNDRSKSDPL